MDNDGLPAESPTAISRYCFLLICNIFTLSKKQQKCNVNEENKNFLADGSDCNAVVDFLLFVQIYRLKYKLYQMKDNFF